MSMLIRKHTAMVHLHSVLFFSRQGIEVPCLEISGHIFFHFILIYHMMSSAFSPQLPTKLNAQKIIQVMKKVQFVGQFFVLSKFSDSPDYIAEFLMVIEAFKFYFKSIAATESEGLYIENDKEEDISDPLLDSTMSSGSTVDEKLEEEKKWLEFIKTKPYQTIDRYPRMTETFANGKKVQLITAAQVPKQLRKSPLKFQNIIGQVLHLLRPLLSIMCIRLFGINSYKSYLISLAIDLAIVFIFQKWIKISRHTEKEEISSRRKQMFSRYIFRKPVFDVLLKYVFMPLLAKIIKPERMISKFVVSLLEMNSSISLTL